MGLSMMMYFNDDLARRLLVRADKDKKSAQQLLRYALVQYLKGTK